jgi:2-succinyl-6-hydroxy-2,4-cyclohexadiene-1-carboxylate synthase
LPDSARAALAHRRRSATAEGLAGALRCLGLGHQPNLWPQLPRLFVPTLLVSGAEDAKFTQLARQMAKELPMAWVRTFEGVGHAPHLECPDDYAAEVTAFFGTPWLDVPQYDHEVEATE